MTIQYSISDLRDSSSKLLNEYSSMNAAVSNLNNVMNSISSHWIGNDQTAYTTQFSAYITSLKSYLSELQTIATNLKTAAEYYEEHEDEFSASLW